MHSIEARKKMSDKNIFIQKSEESTQKMKDSLKGRSTRQGVRINFYDGDELINNLIHEENTLFILKNKYQNIQ